MSKGLGSFPHTSWSWRKSSEVNFGLSLSVDPDESDSVVGAVVAAELAVLVVDTGVALVVAAVVVVVVPAVVVVAGQLN